MSTHILLNLLNELRTGIKCEACRTLNLLKSQIFGMNISRFCHHFCNVIMDFIT